MPAGPAARPIGSGRPDAGGPRYSSTTGSPTRTDPPPRRRSRAPSSRRTPGRSGGARLDPAPAYPGRRWSSRSGPQLRHGDTTSPPSGAGGRATHARPARRRRPPRCSGAAAARRRRAPRSPRPSRPEAGGRRTAPPPEALEPRPRPRRLGDQGRRLRRRPRPAIDAWLAVGPEAAPVPEQPRPGPRGDHAPPHVVYLDQPVADDPVAPDLRALEPLTGHRLHRIPPELGDVHHVALDPRPSRPIDAPASRGTAAHAPPAPDPRWQTPPGDRLGPITTPAGPPGNGGARSPAQPAAPRPWRFA